MGTAKILWLAVDWLLFFMYVMHLLGTGKPCQILLSLLSGREKKCALDTKLPQEVIPHTPQTPCRHHVTSQSVFKLSARKTYCEVMLCQQRFYLSKEGPLVAVCWTQWPTVARKYKHIWLLSNISTAQSICHQMTVWQKLAWLANA